MEKFQLIKICRRSDWLNSFCIEPIPKFAENEIKHAQSLLMQHFWCFIFQIFLNQYLSKIRFFLVSLIWQCLKIRLSAIC